MRIGPGGMGGYQPPMKRRVMGMTTAATTMAAAQAPRRRVMGTESKTPVVNPLDAFARRANDVFATIWAQLLQLFSKPSQ